jgi:Txe/YoeB family toxin of toxin-antitoxin system
MFLRRDPNVQQRPPRRGARGGIDDLRAGGRMAIGTPPGPRSAGATLIQNIARNGNEGIGKPEPLKHGFQGYWSRRINDEHRLLYKIIDDEIRIAQCRYHYQTG